MHAPAHPPLIEARALLLAERLDPRGVERLGVPLAGIIALAGEQPGQAFLFRWGALVTIGAGREAAERLVRRLRPGLLQPLAEPVEETALLRIADDAANTAEGADAEGVIALRDASLPRLALLAEALAKSAVLSHQEAALARSLDRLEPILARLRLEGRLHARSKELLRSIGEAIGARARAAARVDTAAKPDLLWDHPELTALHVALADEWELEERSTALERKLAMLHETSDALLSLVEARRSRGLELAVAALVGVEVAAVIYGLLAP